mgnify:CR=1 FL=1
MTNSWLIALKEYNKNKDKWCIPKKGSKEYNEVIKNMNKIGKKETKEKKPKEKKQTKEKKLKEEDPDDYDVLNRFSEEWWNNERGITAFLTNKKTGQEYYAELINVLPEKKKVEFNLRKEFPSMKPVNKNVKINMNNKNSLYEYTQM